MAFTDVQAGDALGVSVGTIAHLIALGELQSFTVGRRSRRIAVAEIERFIEARSTAERAR